jgi:L-ascorbate metabolism protein UlaG (beta-lactamase superfamily)
MIANGKQTIYFAGDTSYSDHFNHIAKEFPSIDLALMPIAPEFPHPSMRKSHIDSHQAIQAFIDLNAKSFVPMHWGTFAFGTDTFIGPIERLQIAWRTQELHTHKNLIVPKVGQRLHLV